MLSEQLGGTRCPSVRLSATGSLQVSYFGSQPYVTEGRLYVVGTWVGSQPISAHSRVIATWEPTKVRVTLAQCRAQGACPCLLRMIPTCLRSWALILSLLSSSTVLNRSRRSQSLPHDFPHGATAMGPTLEIFLVHRVLKRISRRPSSTEDGSTPTAGITYDRPHDRPHDSSSRKVTFASTLQARRLTISRDKTVSTARRSRICWTSYRIRTQTATS